MLTFARCGSVQDAWNYFGKGKAMEDYYMDSKPGQICGRAARLLGLNGELETEVFRQLLNGYHPRTKESLCRNAGDVSRAPGWDLTFSADKCVSVLWSQLSEEGKAEIEQAHADAVRVAMEHLQQHAAVGRRGDYERERCDWVYAAFLHDSSREGDPQLHTHAFVFNFGQCSDGQQTTLDMRDALLWKMSAGAIYRASLAEGLRQLGYEIEADPDRPEFFKIVGVSQIACDQFSKRRSQILNACEQSGLNPDSPKARERIALATRSEKAQRIREDVLNQWRSEGEAAGFGPRQAEDLRSKAQLHAHKIKARVVPSEALYERLTEMESFFGQRDMWRWAANALAIAGGGYQAVKDHVEKLMCNHETVCIGARRSGAVYSTRSMVKLEREYTELAASQAESWSHALTMAQVDAGLARFNGGSSIQLSDEQVTAVRHIMEERSAVAVVVGGAGTGKTTTFEAARLCAEGAGLRMRGAAPSGKAADGLEQGSGIHSCTLHALLREATEPGRLGRPNDPFRANDVIVVDEAGMIDSRLMHRLITAASDAGAKVVLVGDERQIQAVGAGGAFRAVKKVVDCVSLTQIRRQRDEQYRQAVTQMAAGQAAQALTYFLNQKAVHIVASDELATVRMAAALVTDLDRLSGSQVLGVTNTNAQAQAVNSAVREALKTKDQLRSGISIDIKGRGGRPSGVREFSRGDRILLTKNDYRLNVKNGNLGTVQDILVGHSGVELRIHLDSGTYVTIPVEQYSHLEHGYAVTTHKAQGMTVENAHVLLGGNMQTRESSYVQISRAKASTQLYIQATEVDRLAASVEAPPTERMLAYAQDLADRLSMNLPSICCSDFYACRDWLNELAPYEIEIDEAEAHLQDLSDIVEAMTKSVLKETTLDYIRADRRRSNAMHTTAITGSTQAHSDEEEWEAEV